MPQTQLAAQLYTVRDYTKTPSDLANTLKKVKALGYGAVQLSGQGPVDAKDVRKMLDDTGLICCVTHIPHDRMKNETQKVIEDHKLWGCRYTAVGGFFPQGLNLADWEGFIADYSATARKFAGSGLSLGYHNHSHELARIGDQTLLAKLLEKLDPSIWMEIDTYWVAHGGGDPAAWIRACKGRIPCVHLKDMGINAQRQQYMMEVGEGNLNWPEILKACKEAGVEWYIIEQDTCYRDPFESLGISLKNCKAMGLH